MKTWIALLGCAAALTCTATHAADLSPAPILPGSLQWISPPTLPGAQLSWVLGGEKIAGPYVMRVKLAPGARVTPHTHPDTRHSTVLAGTLYVGFGETADDSRLVAVPVGGVYVAPANTPHFIWAKDGEVLYQESGIGPTGTVLSKRQ